MLNGEMARYQVQDRVRAAEADRIARGAASARSLGRVSSHRRPRSGLLAILASLRGASPRVTVRVDSRLV